MQSDKLDVLGNDLAHATGTLRETEANAENAERLNNSAHLKEAQDYLREMHAKFDSKIPELEAAIAEQKERVDEAAKLRDKYK